MIVVSWVVAHQYINVRPARPAAVYSASRGKLLEPTGSATAGPGPKHGSTGLSSYACAHDAAFLVRAEHMLSKLCANSALPVRAAGNATGAHGTAVADDSARRSADACARPCTFLVHVRAPSYSIRSERMGVWSLANGFKLRIFLADATGHAAGAVPAAPAMLPALPAADGRPTR